MTILERNNPENPEHAEVKLLTMAQTTPIIGTINSEQKMFILAATGAHPEAGGQYTTPLEVRNELIDDGMSPNQLVTHATAVALYRMSGYGFLDTDITDGRRLYTGYARNDLGLLALGAAGHLLSSAYEKRVPIKFITGEQSQRRHKSGVMVDAIETRQQVLSHLLRPEYSHDEWFDIVSFIRNVETEHFQEGAIRNCIEDLKTNGLLQKSLHKIGRYTHAGYRWDPSVRDRTQSLARTYIETFDMLQRLDVQKLALGIGKYIETYRKIRDKGDVSRLIELAQRTAPKHPLFEPWLKVESL